MPQGLLGEASGDKVSPTMTTKTGYRYIVQTEGVRSGKPIVEGTRIAVHDEIGLLQNGESVDSVIECLSGISKAQVYECLAYYEDHRDDIDLLVARQMTESQ